MSNQTDLEKKIEEASENFKLSDISYPPLKNIFKAGCKYGYTLGREAMLSEVLEYLNKRHMECAPDSPLQIKTHFWADILSEHFAKDLESKFKGIEASEGKVEND